jgi:hypothetical protein
MQIKVSRSALYAANPPGGKIDCKIKGISGRISLNKSLDTVNITGEDAIEEISTVSCDT